MLEKEICSKILSAWELDQNHPKRDRTKKPLPPDYHIKKILDQSFLASLKQEEGKPITFALTYLNKKDVESEIALSGYRQLIITFEKEIPLSPDHISKIAPAFDPEISALIVGNTGNGDNNLVVWGGMFFGPTPNKYSEIPVCFLDHNFQRPDIFMVTAKAPGHLVISRGNSRIGSFSSGFFSQAMPTPFTLKGLGFYLRKGIQESKGFKTFENSFYDEYVDAIDYLLFQSSNRGHGATIIILPEDKKETSKQKIISKHRFPEKLQIEELIYQTVNKRENSERSACRKKLAERLDFLAQLSVIDGALILAPNLNVLSFGSRLDAKEPWKGSIKTGPDGLNPGEQEIEFSKHGTRHNSAIDFVASCPGSIAFVISQDGPIRAFVLKDKDTIFCWPDCTTSMFI